MIYHNNFVRTVIDKETKKKTKDNTRAVESNNERINKLERQFEEVSLFTETLWQLLKQETKLNDTDLDVKIEYVFDKKKQEAKLKVECFHCGQKLPVKEKKCYYCGEMLHNNLDI